jgi:hypothetical protein
MSGIVAGMDMKEKTRENRVRRAVERRGLRLVKSRRRDPMAIGYGKYRVETGDGVEATGFDSAMGWGLTLDEVEDRLAGRRD